MQCVTDFVGYKIRPFQSIFKYWRRKAISLLCKHLTIRPVFSLISKPDKTFLLERNRWVAKADVRMMMIGILRRNFLYASMLLPMFFPENEYVLRKNLVNAMHDQGLDKARSKLAACPKKIESVLSCPSRTTFSCIKKLYRTRRHMPKYNLCQEKKEMILWGSRQKRPSFGQIEAPS